MKSTTIAAVITLITLASAASASKNTNNCIVPFAYNTSSTAKVEASINQWLVDIGLLNLFVDTYAAGGYNGSAAIRAAATAVKTYADDESCQYATLSYDSQTSVGGSKGSNTDAFNCAVNVLGPALNSHVQLPLTQIASNSGNASLVQEKMDEINHWRCCNTLSATSIILTDNIVDYSLFNLTNSAPTPKTCEKVECEQVCAGKSNGEYDASIAVEEALAQDVSGDQ